MKNLFPVFILLFLAGCNGKPSDVPKLFPCKITVKKEATPIAGADVILGSDSAGSMWTASGTTDSSGVAKIHTNRLQWRGEGIPAGEYTVVLSKTPKLESISVAEYQKLEPAEQDKYREEEAKRFDDLPREIPVELSEFSNSPFKLTVTEGGENNLEIDISTYKPAKQKKK